MTPDVSGEEREERDDIYVGAGSVRRRSSASKSLVCGVIGLCLAWIPMLGITGVGAAVAGIVFGVLAQRDDDPGRRKAGRLGIALSVLAIITAVGALVAVVAYFGWVIGQS